MATEQLRPVKAPVSGLRESSGRLRARQARRQMYRRLVMDAAESVFADRGLALATMSEIATEAGIARKTLYATFGSKQEIFDAIRALRREQVFGSTFIPAAEGEEPLAAFLRGLREGTRRLLEHPDYVRIQLRDGFAWALTDRTPSDSALSDSAPHSSDFIRYTARAIQRGIDAGIFIDEPAERLARLMTAVWQVELAEWLEGGGREDASRLLDRIEQRVTRLLCREPRVAAKE